MIRLTKNVTFSSIFLRNLKSLVHLNFLKCLMCLTVLILGDSQRYVVWWSWFCLEEFNATKIASDHHPGKYIPLCWSCDLTLSIKNGEKSPNSNKNQPFFFVFLSSHISWGVENQAYLDDVWGGVFKEVWRKLRRKEIWIFFFSFVEHFFF